MEQFDSEKAKRVWQRVQAVSSPPQPQMCSAEVLAAREMAESSVYLKLSGQVKGQDSQALRKMAMEDRKHGEVLRGICRMTTGMPIPNQPPAAESGPIGQRLQTCYGRKMQMAAEYEKRSSDPQFGGVFRKLAEQENAHCQTLLSLIGKY